MAQYAERIGITTHEGFDRFVYLMRRMDDEWNEVMDKKGKDGKS